MPRILVVEDDAAMAAGLRDNLQFEGHQVTIAASGEEGLKSAARQRPDLVLLDVMLPKMDGFEVCRQLREAGVMVPILMLTARSEEIDVVRGLELGADDYVTKPFGVRELLARISAILRRSSGAASRSRVIQVGKATIDLGKGRVTRGKESHVLGFYEIEILRMLTDRPEQNVSRADLLNAIWGLEAYPTNRTVDNHMVSIRRKIEEDAHHPVHLVTVHGIGYKFIP
jgi:DNA-binding response OmpR family regulator